MELFNKTVLITGAAGRIGSAIANKVLENGGTVLLTDIDKVRLTGYKDQFSGKFQENIHLIFADITTSDGIENLLSECLTFVPCIDCAIHSAYPKSKGWGTKFEDLNQDNLDNDLSMQLGGAIMFSQKILKYFLEQNAGNLIHISSILGFNAPKFDHYEGTEMHSPIEYSAIKAGIISITKWLAKYYSKKNIRINCISPGGILNNQPESFLNKYKKSCSNIGMLSAEKHISGIVMFLLSDASIAINGQNIIVDDGWSL